MSTKVRRPDGGYATFPNRWIDAGYMAKAPGSVTQVYMFLCRWSDNSTLAAAQPMKMIARKCGLSEDIARKAIRTLEAWGVIEREPESGPNAVNVWTLLMLQQQAPDYPEKVPPKLSTPPQSGAPQSQGPYQPTSNQPEYQQPEEDISPNDPDLFGLFWQVYPRREGKATARKAWAKAIAKADVETILLSLDLQINNNWQGRDKQYIPLPASWLNGERWDDEIIRPKTNGNGQRKPEYIDKHGNYTVEGSLARARGEI